jgi:hypothetical protein
LPKRRAYAHIHCGGAIRFIGVFQVEVAQIP